MASSSINKSIVISTQEQLEQLEATFAKAEEYEKKHPNDYAMPDNVRIIKGEKIKEFFGTLD
ncbi:MAG: hypothetical protein FWD38_11055 [Oscillospiraceae bacterium]|nr:hypothetical protein [Oscillospiraceae bacterium]